MSHSQQLVDQITLDCLLNRELMGKHIIKQREKQIDKEEFCLHKDQICDLFKDLINGTNKEIPPDIKYAYNTFIKASIHYFKMTNNEDNAESTCTNLEEPNLEIVDDANKLMMRTKVIKIDDHTLDKYIKKNKKKNKNDSYENIIQIKNIENIYEDEKKE